MLYIKHWQDLIKKQKTRKANPKVKMKIIKKKNKKQTPPIKQKTKLMMKKMKKKMMKKMKKLKKKKKREDGPCMRDLLRLKEKLK
jgi:hypothetical protein